MIKDLFGILVIVSECDKACNVGEYLDHENCKCRKKLVEQIVDECAETVEEVEIAKKLSLKMEICINAVLVLCILCYSQQFVQLTLELLLIMFTHNGTQKEMLKITIH